MCRFKIDIYLGVNMKAFLTLLALGLLNSVPVNAGCELRTVTGQNRGLSPIFAKRLSDVVTPYGTSIGGFDVSVLVDSFNETVNIKVTGPSGEVYSSDIKGTKSLEAIDCFQGSTGENSFRITCDTTATHVHSCHK